MKRFYVVLAVVGAIVPLAFFGLHFARSGFDPVVLVRDATATPAATAFLSDLLLSVVVALAFVFRDARELGIARFGAVVAGTLCIGLSFSLPLYLYWRERRREVAPAEGRGSSAARPRLDLPNPERT
jgi:hypothetical protein